MESRAAEWAIKSLKKYNGATYPVESILAIDLTDAHIGKPAIVSSDTWKSSYSQYPGTIEKRVFDIDDSPDTLRKYGILLIGKVPNIIFVDEMVEIWEKNNEDTK